MKQVQLNKEKMMDLFSDLNDMMAADDIRGEIVLFGGTVFVLVLKTRPRTKDVYAIWEPKETIYKLAALVAEKHGLHPNWLNDGVKGWISSEPEKKIYHQYSNLIIYHADLRYILAMKCLAAREDAYDRDDAKTLIEFLEVKSVEECLEILYKYYPKRLIEQKSIYFIEEIFDEIEQA